ncbi:MAG TPA: type II secretion system F family protein [Candidatus Nanopelagicales bacterium]|nr:type II secretion system F family protein [Candidatus Nanopelagicales bacterium]
MGALVGLLAGIGILLALQSRGASAQASPARGPGPLRRRLDAAGLRDVPVARVLATCAGAGAVGGLLMLVVSGSAVVGLAFAVVTAWLPLGAAGRRAARRGAELTAAWPDAVDDLASAVRAGMSLPDAVAALAERGPESLRAPFASFAADHRVTGSFDVCLDRLKAELADPVGDRVVEALRLSRDVGGTELGRLLRTLSSVLREDARTRAELVARQSWAVNAARLAVAAPWATLAFLSLRPGALAAYDSSGGIVVLLVAACLSAAAYIAMRTIGRLPRDERVLA